jgi:hypothetical protein
MADSLKLYDLLKEMIVYEKTHRELNFQKFKHASLLVASNKLKVSLVDYNLKDTIYSDHIIIENSTLNMSYQNGLKFDIEPNDSGFVFFVKRPGISEKLESNLRFNGSDFEVTTHLSCAPKTVDIEFE